MRMQIIVYLSKYHGKIILPWYTEPVKWIGPEPKEKKSSL